MSAYEILIDASVDIPDDIIEKNGIRIVPMKYTVDGKEYVMDRRYTPQEMHEFYDKMRPASSVSTSQITPFDYEQSFRPLAEEGKSFLYIALSSGLSSTYSSALTAIEDLREDYPEAGMEAVDSLGATGGMGLVLLLAIRGREKGLSLGECAAYVREHVLDIAFWFMVDDLVYLRRGGRISAATAVAGTILNIKPVLKIDNEGKLVNIAKQRGAAKTEQYLAKLYESSHDGTLGEDVVIVHADCEDRAERLRQKVLEINPKAVVYIYPLSLIIGAHTGPGMAAVIHYGNRNFA